MTEGPRRLRRSLRERSEQRRGRPAEAGARAAHAGRRAWVLR